MQTEEFFNTRSIKLFVLFIIMILMIMGFVAGVVSIINSNRDLPSETSTIKNRALRGFIVSRDNFSVAKSNKKFEAKLYPFAIDPEKEELFIRLFSIYSGADEESIKERLYDKNGERLRRYVTIFRDIDASTAIYLKSLSRKLRRLGAFRPVLNSRGARVLYGLDIVEAGEEREYSFGDTLTPVIGYTHTKHLKKYTKIVGLKGLERKYEKYLLKKQDGVIRGKRDVIGTIIRSKSAIESTKKRRDGYKVHLNVSMGLQKRVELTLDRMKQEINAKEILAAVMESKTGKILTIASSERYNPNSIAQEDIPKLQAKFTEYLYEAGSVIKPITLSIALELDYITPQTVINTHNGRLPISKRYTITDDEPFPQLSVTDIIVHSSNIGITEIVWKMRAEEFHKGLKLFDLGEPSGIDLPRDLSGKIKSVKLLKRKIDRANQAYGYGMQVTFAQMLKAYSVFNNGGIEVTPRIMDYMEDAEGRKFQLKSLMKSHRAVSRKTAQTMKEILKEVVARGTGKAGQYEGLEVGGKTGTAHIYDYRAKKYAERYNSSFYGFVNDDKGNSYTIGVLVIEANNGKSYFASKSAVPTFRKILDNLVELGYLKPKLTPNRERELQEEEQKRAKLKEQRRVERTRKIKELLRRQREQSRKKINKQVEPKEPQAVVPKSKKSSKTSNSNAYNPEKRGYRLEHHPKPSHQQREKPKPPSPPPPKRAVPIDFQEGLF